MSDGKGFDYGKLMMAAIIVIVAYFILAISDAFAEPTLNWIAPTHNVDGTVIPATGTGSLDGFKVYATPTGPFSTVQVYDITDQALRTVTLTGLSPGIWNFQMTAYNVAGNESERTPNIEATVTTVPTPPSGMSFSTYEVGVYNLVKKANGFTMVYVGQVPLNTPCDPKQNVNGFNAVPVSAVTSWSGTVRPIVVLAKCSIH